MDLDREAVVAAIGRWSYIPTNATRVETDEYQVLRLPGWWAQPLELRWLRPGPARVLEDVLEEAVERCRAFDQPRVCCWVRMDAPTGYEDSLLTRGARLDETLAVLARPLDPASETGGPRLDPAEDVEVRWATDRATFADAMRLGGEVFGTAGELSEEDLDEELSREGGLHAAGEGGSVVAYLDGRAVGTAGLSLIGPDARLWGGAVLPGARGRGIYRALLEARLHYAVARGGVLALVKGRVETSAPTLRRAGFSAVGEERSYLLDL